MTLYINRDISWLLTEALENMPVVVLSGMRQTGKSTLLLNLPRLKHRKYMTFDDLNVLTSTKSHPEVAVGSDEDITIDEAQRFPELMIMIKKEVDKSRRNGRFLLSGSANFLLLKEITETLAGRALYLTLHPFNFREAHGSVDSKSLLIQFLDGISDPGVSNGNIITAKSITTGGFPPVALGHTKKSALWFKGFRQTYLEKDIRNLSRVDDLESFNILLQLTALRSGQILNISQIARDAKVNTMTASRYLSLMETSFVIFKLQPYLKNRNSRLVKSPKIYISDSGLMSSLAGIAALGGDEPLSGAVWETYIANNLVSTLSYHAPDAKLFYWNIQGRYEVDFIIEAGKSLLAVETKYSTKIHDSDLTGIKAFIESNKNCRGGILIYNGPQTLNMDNKIWAIPASVLLS